MAKVPLEQKLYIAFTYTGMNLMNGIVGGSLLMFYTNFLGFPPLLFGIIYLIFAIWNAINDPLIGYVSDLRKPVPGKGKRKYFLKMSIPFSIFGFFIVIIARPEWTVITQFIVLLIGLIIFETAATLVYVNNGALVIGLTDEATERSTQAMINNYVNLIPGAIVGLIPFYFLTGAYSLEFVMNLFIIIGVIGVCIMTIAIFRIKEPTELYGFYEPLKIKHAIKETFKSKAFQCLLFLNFAMSGLSAAFGTAILYYLTYVFKVSEFWAVFPAGLTGILQVLIMPLIIRIQKKLEVRNTYIFFMIILIIGYIGFLLVANYWVMIFFYGCLLTGFSASGLLGTAASGDIIDEDELNTGQRREGMFGGVSALFTIPAQGVFVLFFTILLTIYGFDSSLGLNQTEEAILGIRLGFCLFPMIFLAIGIIILFFYPLHGEYYKVMKEKVRVHYEEKMAKKAQESFGTTSNEGLK